MINLGDEVKNIVTGHKGIVIGISSWLNGCRTIGSKGKMREDGKCPIFWNDEIEMKLVTKRKLKLSKKPTRDTGGPHSIPGRTLEPGNNE